MNIFNAKLILISNIEKYLNNEISLADIREFAWNVIEYFSKTKKIELPDYQDFEKEFWCAIWEIQHLGDENHEESGITKKTLVVALDYLKKNKEIPDSYIGMRP